MLNHTPATALTAAFLISAHFIALGHAQSSEGVRQSVRPELNRVANRVLKRDDAKGMTSVAVVPGSKIASFEMAWNEPSADDVAKRLTGAVAVLLDRKVGDDTLKRLKAAVFDGEVGAWQRVEGVPQVLVLYDRAYNELRLINDELDMVTSAKTDVGEKAAQNKAEDYLAQLAKAGVIDARLYRNAVLQLGYKRVGSAPLTDKAPVSRVAGYRMTFRPRLRGVEVANAGVRLGLLTDGRLVSMRLGGVEPKGDWRDDELVPAGDGKFLTVKVSANEIMKRFYSTAARESTVLIAWSKLMYAMPDDVRSGTIEPRMIISYVDQRRSGNQLVSSRRKMVSYSVVDSDEPPLEYDKPSPTQDDGGKRKE